MGMTLLGKYASSLSTTPTYAKISNEVNINPKSNGIEFNFETLSGCNKPGVMWGSEKPTDQVCPPSNLQANGEACNDIWNNSTSRKMLVKDYCKEEILSTTKIQSI